MHVVPLYCRCGDSSGTEEIFNNLSLNLVPQESVQEMLDHYLQVSHGCPCHPMNSHTNKVTHSTLHSFFFFFFRRQIPSSTALKPCPGNWHHIHHSQTTTETYLNQTSRLLDIFHRTFPHNVKIYF